MNEELEISDHADLTNRLFITLPFATAAIAKGCVVRVTDQYGFSETEGGIILPGKEVHEKKYCLGEVLSVGESVVREEVDVGDIVTYQRTAAFRLPDGINEPRLFRLQADGIGIVACQPNLIPSKRSARWVRDLSTLTLENLASLRVLEVLYAKKAWRLPNFAALANGTVKKYFEITGAEPSPAYVALINLDDAALTAAATSAIEEYQMALIKAKQDAADEMAAIRASVRVGFSDSTGDPTAS